jgi:hypothetical protein
MCTQTPLYMHTESGVNTLRTSKRKHLVPMQAQGSFASVHKAPLSCHSRCSLQKGVNGTFPISGNVNGCNALKLEARKLLERERLGASCGSSKNRNLRMNDSLEQFSPFYSGSLITRRPLQLSLNRVKSYTLDCRSLKESNSLC